MRKIILFMHVTLDGFVAGPNGEMDWINVDDEIFDYAGNSTDNADTALYGRVTYQMMDNYWPTAADQPGASAHDIKHAGWYNNVNKVVLSNSLQSGPNVTVVGGNIAGPVKELKQQPGKDILIFGSPGAVHSLMQHSLIDDFWLFVNPVLIGHGIPLFKDIKDITKLKLINNTAFTSGVIALHYERQ